MREEYTLLCYLEKVQEIEARIQRVMVGQNHLIRSALICLFAGEHLLIEGPPGLGKTKLATTLAKTVEAKFKRIAGTPDLLPRDIIGFPMMVPGTNAWTLKKGSIFTNILLFDEINRTTPKTKSAILQPMQERSVSLELIEETEGGKEMIFVEDAFLLPKPFLVLATMNPIDQEGVYELIEPEKDRFMMKAVVRYPSFEEEQEIVKRQSIAGEAEVLPVVKSEEVLDIMKAIRTVYVDDRITEFAAKIATMTRPEENERLKGFVRLGASPRASMRLVEAARVVAFLEKRSYVVPRDVIAVAHDVLRHRLILEIRSSRNGELKNEEDIISSVLNEVRGYG